MAEQTDKQCSPDYEDQSDSIDESQQARQYEPLPLLPNVQYPTYQLYAVAGQGGTPPETVLTIAVLETMQWLRQRFREFELPPELDWPESSFYEQVDCSEFTSFGIYEGYKVEVILLPEEKILTLQLTEPDLGPQLREESQERQPVPGRLIFHQRAVDEIEKVAPNRLDMDLLCNALEFLATDYRELLAGVIDEEEMGKRCMQKYGRPFEVVPSAGIAAARYPKEYKIKYLIGYKGKPVESVLDYHLKVGNDSERLLRIYFLYDKEKKLIVVGSLPEHLPTVTFR